MIKRLIFDVDGTLMRRDDPYLDILCAKEQGLHTIYVNAKNMDCQEAEITVNRVEDITKELIETLNQQFQKKSL